MLGADQAQGVRKGLQSQPAGEGDVGHPVSGRRVRGIRTRLENAERDLKRQQTQLDTLTAQRKEQDSQLRQLQATVANLELEDKGLQERIVGNPIGIRIASGCRPCRDWSGGQGGQPDAAGQQGATGERRDRGIGHGALERFAVPAASACDNAGA